MDKKLLIGVSVVAVIVAAGIGTWAFGAQGADEVSANGSIISSSNTSATSNPTPGSTDSDTVAPAPVDAAPDVAGDDSGQGTDDTESGVTDMTPWKVTAEAAVRQYLTWDTAESADARSARLAPYFAAGAPELTSIPQPAGEELFSYEGFTSTVTVTSIDYSGVEGASADGVTIPIIVTASYTAAFTSAIADQENFTSGDFTALVSIKDPTRIVSLTQH